MPYVAHLLGVAALVLEDGGDEDEAMGRLFRDRLGRLFRELGQVADQTFLVVAGFAVDVQKIGRSIDRQQRSLGRIVKFDNPT